MRRQVWRWFILILLTSACVLFYNIFTISTHKKFCDDSCFCAEYKAKYPPHYAGKFALGLARTILSASSKLNDKHRLESKNNAETLITATVPPGTATTTQWIDEEEIASNDSILKLLEDHPHKKLNFEEIRTRFKQRLDRYEKACAQYGASPSFRRIRYGFKRKLVIGPYWPVMNTTIEYCYIQKTASTTWKSTLRRVKIEMQKKKIKPSVQMKPELHILHNRRRPSLPSIDSTGNRTVRFFFVREPYGRLLSAYVDKLFCPNTMFWNMIGKYVVENFRHNYTEISGRCGHDVTFPEFIKYFIHSQSTGKKTDGHFVAQHDHCQMCQAHYDYIGNLETLTEDMEFLLNVTQAPINYTKDYSSETIENNAGWVLNSKMTEKILKCMSREEATRRLWKKLQIRGILSKSELYPFSPEQASKVTFDEFVTTAQQALERSVKTKSTEEIKRQKKESLREAFRSVPLADKLKVKDLLFLDFILLGYDPDLPIVFSEHSDLDTTDKFRYFQLWT